MAVPHLSCTSLPALTQQSVNPQPHETRQAVALQCPTHTLLKRKLNQNENAHARREASNMLEKQLNLPLH